MCPNFDIGICEGSNQVIHLTHFHPPCQRLSAVGGLLGAEGRAGASLVTLGLPIANQEHRLNEIH